MKPLSSAALALPLLLAACAGTAPQGAQVPPHPAPGSDRDAHGCIPSAGYQWCAATQACERSWELARDKGFEASAEGFAAYCDTPAK